MIHVPTGLCRTVSLKAGLILCKTCNLKHKVPWFHLVSVLCNCCGVARWWQETFQMHLTAGGNDLQCSWNILLQKHYTITLLPIHFSLLPLQGSIFTAGCNLEPSVCFICRLILDRCRMSFCVLRQRKTFRRYRTGRPHWPFKVTTIRTRPIW